MNSIPKPTTFAEWSRLFKKLRVQGAPADEIVRAYRQPVPGDWIRERWEGELGYRKNSKDGTDRGEQKIERELLGPLGTMRALSMEDGRDHKSSRAFEILTLYHNLPLTKVRHGQVVADVFGVVRVGKELHPLVVEVKKTDHGPWYALIECLQQVKLARSSVKIMGDFWGKILMQKPKGAWGLVVAPRQFYSKGGEWENICDPLLRELKNKTEARIAFAESDDLANGRLKLRIGNWL